MIPKSRRIEAKLHQRPESIKYSRVFLLALPLATFWLFTSSPKNYPPNIQIIKISVTFSQLFKIIIVQQKAFEHVWMCAYINNALRSMRPQNHTLAFKWYQQLCGSLNLISAYFFLINLQQSFRKALEVKGVMYVNRKLSVSHHMWFVILCLYRYGLYKCVANAITQLARPHTYIYILGLNSVICHVIRVICFHACIYISMYILIYICVYVWYMSIYKRWA